MHTSTDQPDVLAYAGQLGEDHPGVRDAAYRARREAIAAVAEAYVPGGPVPQVPYADEEHDVWAQVVAALDARFPGTVADELVASNARLGLPTDHIPQLDEVSALLEPLTGFRYQPVAGLVSPQVFYGALADDRFNSTQYIRHASAPFYTPEPDVIHEVVGHATHLASDRFAALYRAVGAAARACETDPSLQFLSRVFWFTMEFGVLREDGRVKAYGAGILSSVGELGSFHEATLREWDLVAMGTTGYDITRFQDVLFVADGVGHLEDALGALLDGYDDDTPARLAGAAVR